MTREELLAPLNRWMPKRKKALVNGIMSGVIDVPEACQAHNLSADEILEWCAAYKVGGIRGLKVTGRRAA